MPDAAGTGGSGLALTLPNSPDDGGNVKQRKTLLATALIAVLLAGCTDKPAAGPPPASAAPGSSTAATKPPEGKAPSYKLPADMCTAADLAPIQQLFPNVTPRTNPVAIPSKAASAAGVCTVVFVDLNASLGVTLGAEVHTEAAKAKEQYDALRTKVFADYPDAKEVPGLGGGAYVYTDKTLGGERIVFWHGNSHNTIALTKVAGRASSPPDVAQRLTTMAKDMLAKMPRA